MRTEKEIREMIEALEKWINKELTRAEMKEWKAELRGKILALKWVLGELE